MKMALDVSLCEENYNSPIPKLPLVRTSQEMKKIQPMTVYVRFPFDLEYLLTTNSCIAFWVGQVIYCYTCLISTNFSTKIGLAKIFHEK